MSQTEVELIKNNAVKTADIADEQVTLAKLEHGTSSNNGKFLRANNGADPTFETVDFTNLNASNLTSGTVPDARFPATLPAISGANLTNLPSGLSSDAQNNTKAGTGAGANFNGTAPERNTLYGSEAGNDITDGDSNVCIGYQAGDSITTGNHNVAIGQEALSTITTQSDCVAIGKDALKIAQDGASNNICVGVEAGSQITTGDNNVGLGYYPLANLITGSDNIGIGTNAYFGNAYNGCIMLASSTLSVTGEYVMMFGSNAQGRVYNTYNSNASWSRISDVRKKKDIISNTNLGLDFINDLRTVTYKWKAPSEIPSNFLGYDASKTEHSHTNKMYGFIAQEVKESLDKYNITDFNGWTIDEESEAKEQAVSYEMFVIPLVKAVQELSAKVKVLEDKVTALEAA